MRPKHLLEPSLKEGIFVVPKSYREEERASFPSFREIFGNDNPVYIEFCSGNGDWLAENALKNKDINWIGVEKQFPRVRKIWSKKKNHALDNLFIIYGMGEDFLLGYPIDGVVDKIYVNFPDPWPKTRHAKHRIIKSIFIEGLLPLTKAGTTLTVVTDDAPYAKEVLKEMEKHPLWQNSFTGEMPKDYGASYFQRLFLAQEKKIHSMEFVRVG
jgi:tRNA (guanine-N7-)-methyltransferase